MSWTNEKQTLPYIAASAIAQYVPVTPDTTTDDQVAQAGSWNQMPIGIAKATVATWALAVPVVVEGVTKCLVIASAGAGTLVAVGSTNGGVIPITASGLSTALGSALGAQGLRWSVGRLQEARAAGEYGSVFIDPRQIVG